MIPTQVQAKIKRIGILFPEFLGDYLQLIPGIYQLKEILPDARIVFYGTPQILKLAFFHPSIDQVEEIGDWSTAAGKLQLVRSLKSNVIDAVYFTNDPLFWVCKKAGIRHLIHERNTLLFKLFTHGFSPIPDGRVYDPSQRHVLSISSAFNRHLPVDSYRFEPGIPGSDLQLHDKSLQAILDSGPYTAINPDAHSCKKYDPELLHKVVDHLVSRNKKVVVIGLKDHSGISTRSDVVSLVGKTSLFEVFGVIKNAEMFIGYDSGTSHIATAYETPSLTFFPPKGASVVAISALRGNTPYKRFPNQSNCLQYCRHYSSCPDRDCESDYDWETIALLLEQKIKIPLDYYFDRRIHIGTKSDTGMPHVIYMRSIPRLSELVRLIRVNQINQISVEKRVPIKLFALKLWSVLTGRVPFRIVLIK